MSNVFADFLQNSGLYDQIEITPENIYDLISLVAGNVKLDVYCKECGTNRVFTISPILQYQVHETNTTFDVDADYLYKHLEGIQKAYKTFNIRNTVISPQQSSDPWHWSDSFTDRATRILLFQFECSMDASHHLDYIVLTDRHFMRKIGQYPSVADLTHPELDNYKKDISEEDRKELRKAIGLSAQGIGVGSYVYLRRVFERIIDKAKDYAKDHAGENNGFNLADYQKAKMDQKIKMLRRYLPAILTENKRIYSIISKGIHELSEEECNEYFPIMQEAIFMILRQCKQKREELESSKAITSKIAKIAEKMKE